MSQYFYGNAGVKCVITLFSLFVCSLAVGQNVDVNKATLPAWATTSSNSPGGINVDRTLRSIPIDAAMNAVRQVNRQNNTSLRLGKVHIYGAQTTNVKNEFYVAELVDQNGHANLWNIQTSVDSSSFPAVYTMQVAGKLGTENSDQNDYQLPSWVSTRPGTIGGVSVTKHLGEVPGFATAAVQLLNQQRSSNYSIESVEYAGNQVVSGNNYYYVATLTNGDNQQREVWNLKLYVDLSNQQSLTEANRLDKDASPVKKPDWVSNTNQGLPGGISTISDPTQLTEQAETAVAMLGQQNSANLTLRKIHYAGTQVVAGTNYYFTVEVATENSDRPQYWELVLYVDISNKAKLTTSEKL